MKTIMKPLAILIGLSAISGSVNAVTVYNDKGSKVDVTGQLGIEMKLTNDNPKGRILGQNDYIGVSASHKLSKGIQVFGNVLWDANSQGASSVGADVRHELTNDIQVFGRMEWGSETQRTYNYDSNTNFGVYKQIGYVGAHYRGIGEMRIGHTDMPIKWGPKSRFDYFNDDLSYFNYVYEFNNKKHKTINLFDKLPETMTIFAQTDSYKGLSLAATYSDKFNSGNERHHGDIHSAYSVVGFYKSDFGLEANAGYAQVTGQEKDKKLGGENIRPSFPKNSLMAISAEYYFPGRKFSIGLDYQQRRSQNSKREEVQKGSDEGSQAKLIGKGKENLYGVGVKWYQDELDSGLYAGYYLRDANNEQGIRHQEQTYIVGLDKNLMASEYSKLTLFVETKYNSIHSYVQAENKKESILEMGARLSF
ncbi:porin [Xenorhabdus anantnagensis]|uniref:Porin n=1 Tax=Xenorhabdus anantnagensis TaxID=3025875 RepID=A0ABT5LNL6_9GAMM|nr:porin [Xenorhabdus anantnagensis]MDC9595997.1 porin [Xenorhabdus anantnagensis]